MRMMTSETDSIRGQVFVPDELHLLKSQYSRICFQPLESLPIRKTKIMLIMLTQRPRRQSNIPRILTRKTIIRVMDMEGTISTTLIIIIEDLKTSAVCASPDPSLRPHPLLKHRLRQVGTQQQQPPGSENVGLQISEYPNNNTLRCI